MTTEISGPSSASGQDLASLLEALKKSAAGSWPGAVGAARAASLEAFLREKLAHYSQVLDINQEALLEAFERRRNYNVINYYQEANFPDLNGVVVVHDLAEFKERYPSGRFVCPACGGESTNPYTCNSGRVIDVGRECDWKSFGLFGTMGKGMRVVFRGGFLDNPIVDEIFSPIEAATTAPERDA